MQPKVGMRFKCGDGDDWTFIITAVNAKQFSYKLTYSDGSRRNHSVGIIMLKNWVDTRHAILVKGARLLTLRRPHGS